jgi:Fur family transcriptional regulator, ferric uptake regulator
MKLELAQRHPDKMGLSTGDKIRAAFDEQGQRKTHQKDLISTQLAKLASDGVDFSVEELWQDLRQTDPHVGRTTVFRAVEMLVNQGLLNRIDFADGSHKYRACGESHHHHLTCVQCHRVVDIDICLPIEQLSRIGVQNDFVIEGHSLTLYGRCSDCQKIPESMVRNK